MKENVKNERVLTLVFVILLLLLCALAIFYSLCGKSIIEAAYDGRSLPALNNLIKYQHTKPVEHYMELADVLFYRGLFLGSAFLGFTALVVRLIFFKKPPHAIWVAVFGTLVILGVHLLNPNNRVYGSHGFMHAGIVYEILNGNIPPSNPFLGRMPLLWPWGHHFLAAAFVWSLNISPPWAFALINMLALPGIVFLAYRTSRLLIGDSRANVFSVILSLFAAAFIDWKIAGFFDRSLGVFVECKATPAFARFTNSSGIPIGLLFYFLFVYTVLLIFNRTEKWRRLLIVLLISVVGTGVFYFQMLPGLLGSFGALFLFRLYCLRRNKTRNGAFKLLGATATVGLGCLILLPYALSLTSGQGGKINILTPSWIWHNFTSIFFVSLPVLTLILISRKHLKHRVALQPMYDFIFLTLGVSATYICLHFPGNNEYKFLAQAMAMLGILGGIALAFHCNGKMRYIALIVTLIFSNFFFRDVEYKLRKQFSESPYQETGRKIFMTGEEGELYEWLVNNTPGDIMIVDTDLKVPFLAQRQLFIVQDKWIDGQIILQPGIGLHMRLLFIVGSGYSPDLVDYRYRIMDKIYDPKTKMDDEELTQFFLTHDNILIILRRQDLASRFTADRFDLVFNSSNSNFKIYRPGNWPTSEKSPAIAR